MSAQTYHSNPRRRFRSKKLADIDYLGLETDPERIHLQLQIPGFYSIEEARENGAMLRLAKGRSEINWVTWKTKLIVKRDVNRASAKRGPERRRRG